MPLLRASCRHQPSPNTVPLLTTTTHRTSLSRMVSRIRPWQLGGSRGDLRRHTAIVACGSGVNASRWLSGKARHRPMYLVRIPWLDTYFLHTFVFLSAFFFFGHDDLGRGLCYALAFGIYMSPYLKDLVCSPRPYAPPVVRLTVENHHLEYGSPSTHSTNPTPMALFLGAHVYDLHRLGGLPLDHHFRNMGRCLTYIRIFNCGRGCILECAASWIVSSGS
ncbi:hypothetical protein EDB89DRAFT_836940 [Lactarius sanguifluus]|nr:hypothetical protein EDB89DRAFT_836940 [Lactarius sanguifluus]